MIVRLHSWPSPKGYNVSTMVAYFSAEDEATLRRWWRRGRLRGRRSFESQNELGEPDTLRLEITLKPPLPPWIANFTGPPETSRTAA